MPKNAHINQSKACEASNHGKAIILVVIHCKAKCLVRTALPDFTGKASANETLPKKERPRREPGSQDELTATGRRKRKDVGAKREGAAKGWTEEEERLFLEGLELFGREWHKAAAHVGKTILFVVAVSACISLI